MFDRDVRSHSYCSTSPSWQIRRLLQATSQRGTAKTQIGSLKLVIALCPWMTLGQTPMSPMHLNARLANVLDIWPHVTVDLLVMFFGTYLDPKQKCVDTFHFWYMQEVLRRSLGYRYVAGNGKMLYPSMTTVSSQAFTSFSHFHFIDAAPRTNCWKGPSFSVEAAGESISFERKSHGWIRMRTFSSMFKGSLSMLDFVLLFLLAIPFLFCTWEDHTMQSAWSSLMCEKCFKFQALQKQHQ